MTVLIAKQHLLPSLRWLIQKLARERVFSTINLLVKDYSAIPGLEPDLASIAKFYRSEKECFLELDDAEVVLLDEGGGLHASLPESLAPRTSGVEQTTFGLRTSWNCPTVLVCRSAAKLLFESQIVARGILRKIDSLGLLDGSVVGVIGLGALGSEVARSLMDRGIPTLGTDINGAPVDLHSIAASRDALLRQCSLIFGCSGRDTLAEVDVGSLGGTKIFVSCSSSNVEFHSILARLPASEPFGLVQGGLGRRAAQC